MLSKNWGNGQTVYIEQMESFPDFSRYKPSRQRVGGGGFSPIAQNASNWTMPSAYPCTWTSVFVGSE